MEVEAALRAGKIALRAGGATVILAAVVAQRPVMILAGIRRLKPAASPDLMEVGAALRDGKIARRAGGATVILAAVVAQRSVMILAGIRRLKPAASPPTAGGAGFARSEKSSPCGRGARFARFGETPVLSILQKSHEPKRVLASI